MFIFIITLITFTLPLLINFFKLFAFYRSKTTTLSNAQLENVFFISLSTTIFSLMNLTNSSSIFNFLVYFNFLFILLSITDILLTNYKVFLTKR